MTPGSLRALMPALVNKTYFNYGGQGPLPTPSLEAITSTWGQIQELGPFTGAVWPLIEGTTSRLRRHLGQWFGVGTHRVAFSENVTTACVLPLWGLPWQAGDELLISAGLPRQSPEGQHTGCGYVFAEGHPMGSHPKPLAQVLTQLAGGAFD